VKQNHDSAVLIFARTTEREPTVLAFIVVFSFCIHSQGGMVMLKVHARNLGNVTILCLEGRIVNGETETLRSAVHSQSEVSAVVLDLARVSTVDAGGLGVLLELREQTESKGIGFKLMNVTKPVSSVLEVTRLDSVFEVISGVELLPAVSHDRPASVMELAPCT
jgi:anti-anti-sigma factor